MNLAPGDEARAAGTEVVEEKTRLAERGSAQAQYELAVIHLCEGRGREVLEGFDWLDEAAARKHAGAIRLKEGIDNHGASAVLAACRAHGLRQGVW